MLTVNLLKIKLPGQRIDRHIKEEPVYTQAPLTFYFPEISSGYSIMHFPLYVCPVTRFTACAPSFAAVTRTGSLCQ